MNKTVLILLLALSSVSAFTQWGGGFGNYGGYGGYSKGRWSGGFTGGWGNSADFTGDLDGDVDTDYTGGQDDFDSASVANGGAYNCPDAIANVNRAFDQLVEDVRAQFNEWIVYSDLDAVDEAGFYLGSNCDVQKLDVVSQGSKACKGLGKLLEAIVQQAEVGSFRGDYQQGAQLSEQALSIGKSVESGCQVKVVKKQQEQRQEEEEEIEQEDQSDQPEEQHRHQSGQHESFATVLYKKFAKPGNQDFSQYGNKFASQYTKKYASKYSDKYSSQYTNKYANQYGKKDYGKDYVDQGKSMTRLGKGGQGQKYGEDQADLSNKINKEYTAKYGKKNKYQEKYQHNNEEENKIKNEEDSTLNLTDMFIDLAWL